MNPPELQQPASKNEDSLLRSSQYLYQLESKTLLHMFEFSWWRGNSEPGMSCFLLLRDTTLFPDGRLSYLVTYSLHAEDKEEENQLIYELVQL